jgi:hypothetical protein
MRTFRKILVGIGLAGALSLGVIWGSYAPPTQQGGSADVIQKPGHGALAWEPGIQKPGH